ncbi:hypothetical protein ES708_11122 [subsurface metagenome]
MQETATDNPGRCFAVHANPGDVVIVPPFWAHATISADPDVPLTFGAWCDREYGFDYDDVRAHKGLAWFPVYENDQLTWRANKSYIKSKLIEKKPGPHNSLGIIKGKSIYNIFEDNPGIFEFVPKPYLIEEYWKNFIP